MIQLDPNGDAAVLGGFGPAGQRVEVTLVFDHDIAGLAELTAVHHDVARDDQAVPATAPAREEPFETVIGAFVLSPSASLSAAFMIRFGSTWPQGSGSGSCRRSSVSFLFAGEEGQDVGHESLVMLEHATVAGVRVDLQGGVGQPAGHVGRVAAVDHQVVIAVGDQHWRGDGRQIVGPAQAGMSDSPDLGQSGLHRDLAVTIGRAFPEAAEVLLRGALALAGAGKKRKSLASLNVSAAFT